MADISASLLKIARAKHHLDVLRTEVTNFGNSHPYSFGGQPQFQITDELIRIVHIARGKRIPDEWSLRIGEFAHNARGALDMLIGSISILPESDIDGRRGLQFPIFDIPKRLGSKGRRGYFDMVDTYLAGVSTPDRTIVESFQPYHRGSAFLTDPLALLADINDTDKHRLIVVLGAIANLHAMTLGPGRAKGIEIVGNASIRLGWGGEAGVSISGLGFKTIGDGVIDKDGTPVAEMTCPRAEFMGQAEMDVQFEYDFDIKFGPSCTRVERRPVMDTLTTILDRVEEIIGKFK
jgi:hypothetical protein